MKVKRTIDNMDIKNILEEAKTELLSEAGLNYHGDKKKVKKARILHHDDMDGIFSAIAIGKQIAKEFPGIKIVTEPLRDGDPTGENEKKLSKKPGELLVVVDFNRFKDKDKADKNIDMQTDHHGLQDGDDPKAKGKSLRPEFGSDTMHISSTKANNMMNNTDLKGITAVDSASFGTNMGSNHKLKLELDKKDGPENYKTRLAIITNSLVGQLVRAKGTRNLGAVKNIIQAGIKSPTLASVYNATIKSADEVGEQLDLLYAKKPNFKKVEAFNKKVKPEMRIGINKDKEGNPISLRKEDSKGPGTYSARRGEDKTHYNKQSKKPANIENIRDMAKTALEKELVKDERGHWRLKSVKPNAFLKPWDDDPNAFKALDKKEVSAMWAEARKSAGIKSFDEFKEKGPKRTAAIKKYNELEKAAMEGSQTTDKPSVKRVSDNIAVQTAMKGPRYNPFNDDKISSAFRDFSKFWQMSMSPDYYAKFKRDAAKKGATFDPKKIDLITIGKEAQKRIGEKRFTVENIKKAGIADPERVAKVLQRTLKQDLEKSGGHTSITNMNLSSSYEELLGDWEVAIKAAKQLKARHKKRSGLKAKESDPTSEKLDSFIKKMTDKSRKIDYFLKDTKEMIMKDMAKTVQTTLTKNTKDFHATRGTGKPKTPAEIKAEEKVGKDKKIADKAIAKRKRLGKPVGTQNLKDSIVRNAED